MVIRNYANNVTTPRPGNQIMRTRRGGVGSDLQTRLSRTLAQNVTDVSIFLVSTYFNFF